MPVSKSIPRKIKNIPPIMEMAFIQRNKLLTWRDAEPMPAAMAKNGRANPRENTLKRRAPCKVVVDVEASNNIEPKIGPTQGVHPNAKALPKTNEFTVRPLPNRAGVFIWNSRCKNGSFKIFSMKRPKMMTKIPPIRDSHKR